TAVVAHATETAVGRAGQQRDVARIHRDIGGAVARQRRIQHQPPFGGGDAFAAVGGDIQQVCVALARQAAGQGGGATTVEVDRAYGAVADHQLREFGFGNAVGQRAHRLVHHQEEIAAVGADAERGATAGGAFTLVG